MQVKKIETEKAVAYVYYNNLPTKEKLEEACSNFMKNVLKTLEEKEGKRNAEG